MVKRIGFLFLLAGASLPSFGQQYILSTLAGPGPAPGTGSTATSTNGDGGPAIAAIGVVDTSGALDMAAFMNQHAAIQRQVKGE